MTKLVDDTPPPAISHRFARLAQTIGVDMSNLPELLAPQGEAWMLHSELAADQGWTSEKPCPGMMIITDRSGLVWVAECNTCRFECARRPDSAATASWLIDRAQLPARFLSRAYERDASPVNEFTRRAIWAWFDQEDLTPAPALWGRPGRGKSHLFVVVCRELITRRRVHLVFRTAPQFLADLQAAMGSSAYDETWHAVAGAPMLVLDDLGAEMDTDWRADRISALVDERYRADLPLAVTTNVAPDRWDDAFDARTASRLREMTFPLELVGEDRRVLTGQLAAVPNVDGSALCPQH